MGSARGIAEDPEQLTSTAAALCLYPLSLMIPLSNNLANVFLASMSCFSVGFVHVGSGRADGSEALDDVEVPSPTGPLNRASAAARAADLLSVCFATPEEGAAGPSDIFVRKVECRCEYCRWIALGTLQPTDDTSGGAVIMDIGDSLQAASIKSDEWVPLGKLDGYPRLLSQWLQLSPRYSTAVGLCVACAI